MINKVKITNNRLETDFELTKQQNIEIEYENGDKIIIEPRWSEGVIQVFPQYKYVQNANVLIRTHKNGFAILSNEDEEI